MDPARLEKELGRARSPIKTVKGHLVYEPAGKELYRITQDGEAAVIQTLDGRKVARIESDHDFWAAVNTFANLGYRLKEFGDAVKTPLNDISVDVKGSEVTASAAGASYTYIFQPKHNRPWALDDTLRVGEVERRLNMGSIKAAIKKLGAPEPGPKPPKQEKTRTAPGEPVYKQPDVTQDAQPPITATPAYVEEKQTPEILESVEEDKPVETGLLLFAVFDANSVKDAFLTVMRYDKYADHDFNIKVDKTGLTVYKMDKSHVTMIITKLKAEHAKKFSYNAYISYEASFSDNAEISRLEEYLEKISGSKRATIRVYKKEKGYRLELHVDGMGNMELVKTGYATPIPRLEWVASLKAPIKELTKELKQSYTVVLGAPSNDVRYLLKITVSPEESAAGFTYIESFESDVQMPAIGAYSASILYDVFGVFKQFTDTVTLKFAKGKDKQVDSVPMSVFWENGMAVECLVAPRIDERYVEVVYKMWADTPALDEMTPVTRYLTALEPEDQPDVVLEIGYPKSLARLFRAATLGKYPSPVYVEVGDKMLLTAVGDVKVRVDFRGYKLLRDGKTLFKIPASAARTIYNFLSTSEWKVTLSIYLKSRKAYFTTRGQAAEAEIAIVDISVNIGPYEYEVHPLREEASTVFLHVRLDTKEFKKAVYGIRGKSIIRLTASGNTLIVQDEFDESKKFKVPAKVIKEGSVSEHQAHAIQQMADCATALGDEAELRVYGKFIQKGAIMELIDEDGAYQASVIL